MKNTAIDRRAMLQLSFGTLVAGWSRAWASDVTVAPANATVDLARKGLQIAITGSGSALPDPFRGGASCALIIDGRILQFDFGRQVVQNLTLLGINPARINEVFFTHMHVDHINDYDYYAMTTWLSGAQQDVTVYGPPGTQAMSDAAIKGMNKVMYDLASGMRNRPVTPLNVRSESPFTIKEVRGGLVVESDLYKITCARVAHTTGDVISLGYRVETKYGVVAISGDTGPSDAMVALGKDADVMLHECTMPDYGMTKGGSFSGASVHDKGHAVSHSTPTDLGITAAKANVKMLVPYHLPPYGSVPAAVEMSSLFYGKDADASIWAQFVAAIAKNFKGKIVMAQDRMILTMA